MIAMKANGIKFKVFGWRIRVWFWGFEYFNNLGGRVIFFPWRDWFKK